MSEDPHESRKAYRVRRVVVSLITVGSMLILLTNTHFGKSFAAGLWVVGFSLFVVSAIIVLRSMSNARRADTTKEGY